MNGDVAELATQVADGDDVRVDGAPVAPEAIVTVVLNKPRGVVTTAHDPQGRPTVTGLVHRPRACSRSAGSIATRPGVLLLTNDGGLADRLMHPAPRRPQVVSWPA